MRPILKPVRAVLEAGVLCVTVILVIGVLWVSPLWPVVVPVGEAPFGDLQTLTVHATCSLERLDWNASPSPCYGIDYNYPAWWVGLFGYLGVGSEHTALLGFFLIACFITAAYLQLLLALRISLSKTRLLLPVLALVSPPVLLAIERGQTDLLVFLLLSVSSFFALRSHWASFSVTLSIATAVKLFAAGSFVAMLIFSTKRRDLYIGSALLLMAGVVIFRDLARIAERTPQIPGNSFGVSVPPLWVIHLLRIDVDWNGPAPRILGFVMWLLLLAVLIVVHNLRPRLQLSSSLTSLYQELYEHPRNGILFMVGSGAFVFSFLLGSNFDYRLITAIPVIVALTGLRGRLPLSMACALTVASFMSSDPPAFVQVVGDGLLLVVSVFLAYTIILVVSARFRSQRSRSRNNQFATEVSKHPGNASFPRYSRSNHEGIG